MSMILLEPAYKILHAAVEFKRRTISVTPYFGSYGTCTIDGINGNR
jgi:hypothetical protein